MFLHDGRLDISNNLSERGIKPFVIGRKGWLFADSVAGAHAAATIFSVIETCRYHQVEPYDYLRHVLDAIPQCNTIDDYEKLLPYNYDKVCLIIGYFLPPYSPDMNPIENMWSKIKNTLRRLAPRTTKQFKKCIRIAFEEITKSDLIAWFKHCGYSGGLNRMSL